MRSVCDVGCATFFSSTLTVATNVVCRKSSLSMHATDYYGYTAVTLSSLYVCLFLCVSSVRPNRF
jgi:hypothetical protein